MAKLGMLIGFGAGYVLGARAGRERYDQMVEKAQDVWSDPRVQKTTSQAQDAVQDKAAQAAGVVQEKASSAAKTVQDTAKDKMSGRGTDTSAAGGEAAPTTPLAR